MTESELARQFADVMARYATPELAPDEWTIAMFAQAQKITTQQADLIMRRAVADHAVVSVGKRHMPNGHDAEAYRYVSSPTPAT